MDSAYVWPVPANTWGFFSMLYFLRTVAMSDTLHFHIDAEKQIAAVQAIRRPPETINYMGRKVQAIRFDLRFTPTSKEKRPWKTDLFTNRLTQPNSSLTIWLTDDHARLPAQITFHQSPFDLMMVLDSVESQKSH